MPDDNETQKAIDDMGKRDLGNIKVLMVEDDNFFSELVLTKLSRVGCIPYSTTDGNEALKLADQYRPNLIILDLMLPGTSGEDILKGLKGNNDLKDIPVIVFSNKSNEADIKANIDAGASEFLVKSTTDLNALTEVVKHVLGS